MADRWVPVLAAVLGLLGGMGGAAVGGYVANKGQEQRFQNEQSTRLRDLRTETYVKFLRAAQTERDDGPDTGDPIVRTAEAEVALVAGSAVRRAAAALLTQALNAETEPDYRRSRTHFIEEAQAELDPAQ